MSLSPQERADFDEIVTRLRLEDAGVGTIAPSRRSAALAGLIAAVLVFASVLALVARVPEALGPIIVAVVLAGFGLLAWKTYPRSS